MAYATLGASAVPGGHAVYEILDGDQFAGLIKAMDQQGLPATKVVSIGQCDSRPALSSL
jgi:hypothetical protein